MEYKFVNKYLNKKSKKKNNFFSSFLIRLCISIIILILVLIGLKYDQNTNKIVSKFLNDKNINMASINNWYKKNFGDITPFQNLVKDKSKLVFNDVIKYTNLKEESGKITLSVSDTYLVPVIESGIVVFQGEKEGYGKTIIIEQTDGVYVWYGNIENSNLNVYDYASKSEIIGEAKKTLYLSFQKNGEYVDYKKYLK